MKNNDEDIPIVIQFIGGILIASIFLYFVGKLLGYTDVNKFLKEHGSLIAGILAIGGVAWMVHSQKLETEKVIQSNNNVMKSEAFEMQRIKALEYAFTISRKLDELRGSSSMNYIMDFYRWIHEEPGVNHFGNSQSQIYFLRNFLYGDREGIVALGVIQDFIALYEDLRWRNDTANVSFADFIMLIGKLKILDKNKSDTEYLIYDPYFRINTTLDIDEYAEQLLEGNFSFNAENPIVYIIGLAIPKLISALNNKQSINCEGCV